MFGIGTVLCAHRYILEGGVAQSGNPQAPENINRARQRLWAASFPPPVNRPATAGLTVRLGRRDGKAGARKMHRDLTNSGVVTLDGDLIDA